MLFQGQKSVRMTAAFVIILCHTHAQRLIDIGRVLNENSRVFPSENRIPFKFITKIAGYQHSGIWLAYYNFETSEAVSTHVDAPYSFNRNGWKIDEIPLEKLVGPAVVIDVRSKVENNPLYVVTPEDVDDWISKHGNFPNNSIVIFHTGWNSRYPNAVEYYGSLTNIGNLKYPSVREGTLQRILDNAENNGNQISGLGIDSGAFDLLPGLEVHTLAARKNIYVIPSLNGMIEELPPKGAHLLVMPTKIKGGAAAPARVIATLPENLAQNGGE